MNSDRRTSSRTVTVAFAVVALLTSSGCDASSDASRPTDTRQHEEHRPSQAATDDEASTAPDRETPSKASGSTPTGSRPCKSQTWSAWTTVDRTTQDVGWADIGDLVVDKDGTATLALDEMVEGLFQARTLSLPSAEGDPQKLPGPPPNMPVPEGHGVSAYFSDETHLGVDDSGTLTAMFRQDVRRRRGMGSETYDLVLSDRPTGRAWPPDPHVAGTAFLLVGHLAVNASGAAVVAWQGFEEPLRVSYRPIAGAAWSPAEPVRSDAVFVDDVGIDDDGRVVMLYGNRDQEIVAVRGTPGTGWSRPTPLAGNDHQLEVSTGGAALVTAGRGFPNTRHYTYSMSPRGTWGPAVRQPDTLGLAPVLAIDGAGRGAYMFWHQRRLSIRWSGPGGRWHKPCVLTDRASDPFDSDEDSGAVAANSRGDAVVVYRVTDDTPQLWARYKPAGEPWTEPIEVTAEATGGQRAFRVAIGASGHAAIAWVTPKFEQVDLMRMAPAR
jgi:hypothetical protein